MNANNSTISKQNDRAVPTARPSERVAADDGARVLLFGMWALHFDFFTNSITALTPSMAGANHTHEYLAVTWRSKGDYSRYSLGGLQYSVAENVPRGITKLDEVVSCLLRRDAGLFLNSQTLEFDDENCLAIHLGAPRDIVPLQTVPLREQFEDTSDLNDNNISVPTRTYPGVWCLIYGSPQVTLSSSEAPTGSRYAPLEFHVVSDKVDDPTALRQAKASHARLMSHLRKADENPPEIHWARNIEASSNRYLHEAGVLPEEINDTERPRLPKDPKPDDPSLAATSPANCGRPGTVYVPFSKLK